MSQGIALSLPGRAIGRLPAASLFVPAAPLLVLIGFSLSMDRLPLSSRPTWGVAPAAAVLALALVPFIIRKSRWTPISAVVVVFFAYAVIHSTVFLGVDLLTVEDSLDRTGEWLSQVAALLIGIVTFLVLRTVFIRVKGPDLWKWMLIGAIPALAMAMVQVIAWDAHSGVAGSVNLFVRSTLFKLHFMPDRVSGLAVEPASYAGYAAIIVLPLAAMATFFDGRWTYGVLFLAATGVSLIFTLGGVGALNIGLVCVGLVAFTPGKWRKFAFIAAVVFAVGTAAILNYRPNSYLRTILDEHNDQLDRTVAANESAGVNAKTGAVELVSSGSITVATKVGSTLDPVLHLASSRVSVGYGLGATGFHTDEVLYAETVAKFKANYAGRISLHSLFGRLLVETGLVGVVLFLLMGAVAFWRASTLVRGRQYSESVHLLAARVGLFVFAGGVFVSLASFAMPYIWFWLAVIDSCEPALAGAPESGSAAPDLARNSSGIPLLGAVPTTAAG